VRPFLLAVLFLALAAISVTAMVILVVPEVAGLVGGPAVETVSVWRVLVLLVAAVALVFGAIYAAGLLWLLLACRLFKRDEVEQILKAGPNTRLEIWLFERFSR